MEISVRALAYVLHGGRGGRGTVGFVMTSRVHVSHASEERLRTVFCEPDIGGGSDVMLEQP